MPQPPISSHGLRTAATSMGSAFEHEMDEIIGLGSRLNLSGNDLRPQDLFSWSSAGNRNITTSGARYFSINGGITNIVGFNQRQNGDLGDWLSEDCPQANPCVQNAFTCQGQFSDIAATSPEGINLDVIGYDLVDAAPHLPGPPIVATNPATNVTNFSATLNGTVNPNGLSTAVHFEYGTTINYVSSTATQNYSGSYGAECHCEPQQLDCGRDLSFPNRRQQCCWDDPRHRYGLLPRQQPGLW